MDLFAADDAATTVTRPARPLAVRMRPRTLDEVVGQGHLLAAGSPLRQLVEPNGNTTVGSSSVILWGPPGTGKTTIASIVAGAEGRHFTELSAVTAGVKDVRAVVEEARHRLAMTGKETVLFIDEVHRFTTAQQDALLPSVENRWVTLIAATTENPSFSVNAPLLSRSLLVTLQPLGDDDVRELIGRAVTDERGLADTVVVAEDAVAQIVRLAGGDGRRALTLLEAAAGAAEPPSGGETIPVVTEAAVARAADAATVRYDRAGDQHYDVISAFIKSIRGSDVDAALHYLARMIAAGEDPRFISRRLIVSASEDIGMADPSALQTAVAAAQAVALIGMPEGRIVLAEAVVHLATAPKSNAVIVGIDSALADVRSGQIGVVPAHLRDAHYAGAKGLGHGKGYRYPHDEATGVSQQQYLPDVLAGRSYYRPTQHGFERAVTQRWERIRALLAGRRVPDSDDRRSTGGAVE